MVGKLNQYGHGCYLVVSTNGEKRDEDQTFSKVADNKRALGELRRDVYVNASLTALTAIAIGVIIFLSVEYSPYISVSLIVPVPLLAAQVNGVRLLNLKLQNGYAIVAINKNL